MGYFSFLSLSLCSSFPSLASSVWAWAVQCCTCCGWHCTAQMSGTAWHPQGTPGLSPYTHKTRGAQPRCGGSCWGAQTHIHGEKCGCRGARRTGGKLGGWIPSGGFGGWEKGPSSPLSQVRAEWGWIRGEGVGRGVGSGGMDGGRREGHKTSREGRAEGEE